MRLAIDTSSVSFRFVGSLLAGAGIVVLLGGIFVKMLLAPGLLLTAVGAWLRRSPRYVVRRSPAAVLTQLAHTLDLMMWKYERRGDSISVPSTGTLVEVKPLLWLTLLSFRFGGASAEKERYLASTLVKYQRFT
ncbi:MAG: hypothetical protein ACJ78Q_08720 [Chloroflexia bacterium]